MEKEIEKRDFNFNEKLHNLVEVKEPFFTSNKLKNLKFTAFLIIGGLSIGVGLGLTTGVVQGYKITQESDARMNEIKFKSEFKESELKKIESAKIELQSEHAIYDLWVNNKENLISNYESQLLIYDEPYKNIMTAVTKGLLNLKDVDEVRSHYQGYKININEYIEFVNKFTVSFDSYHNLNDIDKKFINEELNNYKSGSLHRSSELEEMLLKKLPDSDDYERKNIRNKMINDLAYIMNNNNTTTKIKKLKR